MSEGEQTLQQQQEQEELAVALAQQHLGEEQEQQQEQEPAAAPPEGPLDGAVAEGGAEDTREQPGEPPAVAAAAEAGLEEEGPAMGAPLLEPESHPGGGAPEAPPPAAENQQEPEEPQHEEEEGQPAEPGPAAAAAAVPEHQQCLAAEEDPSQEPDHHHNNHHHLYHHNHHEPPPLAPEEAAMRDGFAAGQLAGGGPQMALAGAYAPSPLAMHDCPVHGFVPGACALHFVCKRHMRWHGGQHSVAGAPPEQVSKWRQKERLKTSSVALVVCLNIGVDPPDVIKISPCARLECWVDPLAMQSQKALETIGKNLQAQYERWQPRAKYKMHLDPTAEDMKKLCISARRNAKGERMLFHYNGHGVPRPTVNGEIWVFNKSYTQYIPLSVYDLQAWVGTPAIYVFDCSAAGLVLNTFKLLLEQRLVQQLPPGHAGRGMPQGAGGAFDPSAEDGSNPGTREVILLAACGANELLPQSPDLPADVFTACLTTPIKVALRWFCSRSLLKNEGLSKDQIDRIPGKQTDRKTLLGELNWIFTAITDTIAWNVLPRALFQKLFRQDLLVASLFRNFLLAERIMRAANCSPVSYPQLPPTHQHPMWQAWDMAAERCLAQLPELLATENGSSPAEFQPSPFFSEQLTAFEIWLQHGSKDKRPPEQLPIVLQVLLSQVHRMRALLLLGRFLDMGSWAVDLALSVGIFPYVLKLLQTTATDLRQILVFIWTKILALDRSCQADLVKDNGHNYFIKFLDSNDSAITPASRAMAAFVLSVICDGHSKGQMLCANAGLLTVCLSLLPTPASAQTATNTSPALIKWLLLCLGKLCENMPEIAAIALREQAATVVSPMLSVDDAEVRAAAVFALGSFITTPSPSYDNTSGNPGAFMQESERLVSEREIACYLIQMVYDASALVRAEISVAMSRIAMGHAVMMHDAVMHQVRSSRDTRPHPVMTALTHSGALSTGNASMGDDSPDSADSAPGNLSSGAAKGPLGCLEEHRNSSEWGHGANPSGSFAGHQMLGGAGSIGPTTSFPGICVASRTGHLLPVLDSSCSQPETAANWASADAARVGSGMYEHLCQAMFLLATDPAPEVAKLGAQALSIFNVELKYTPSEPSSESATISEHKASSIRSSGAVAAFGKFRRSIIGGGSTPAAGPSAEKAVHMHVSHSGPPRYALRKITRPLAAQAPAYAGRDETVCGGVPQAGQASLHPPGPHPLPVSKVFELSAEALSNPLLPLDGGDIAHGLVDMSRVHKETVVLNHHYHEPETRAQLVMDLQVSSGLRLKESIKTLETGGDSTAALHFSPFDPLLACIDQAGVVRTYNIRGGEAGARPLNRFRLAAGDDPASAQGAAAPASGLSHRRSSSGSSSPARDGSQHGSVHGGGALGLLSHEPEPTVDVVHTFQLNELHGTGLLGVCGSDGIVRLWRNHGQAGQQQLASGWQAVPRPPVLDASSGSWWACAFSVSTGSNSLFASGGSHPRCVNTWDLTRELCVGQTVVKVGDDSRPDPAGASIQLLSADRTQPLLALGCSGALVQLLDLRAPYSPSLRISARAPSDPPVPLNSSELMGLALRPSTSAAARIVTAGANGMLKLWDLRSTREPVKSIQAHSPTSGLSVLAVHPNAPLFATATKTHSLKVWTAAGDNVGAMRAASGGFLGAGKSGAITCLQFHPYQWKLAAGGDTNYAAIYTIERSGSGAPVHAYHQQR